MSRINIKVLMLAMLIFFMISCGEGETNHPPVAESMIVSPVTLKAGSEANITVIATDADGDALAFYWGATRGAVPTDNAGPSITYTAPPTGGLDTIIVNITDGKAATSRQISVSVEVSENEEILPTDTPNPTPTIEPTTPTPPITPIPNRATPTVTILPPATIPNSPTYTPASIPSPDSTIEATSTLQASMNTHNTEMVLVPAGSFTMGVDSDLELERCDVLYPGGSCQLSLYDDENPIHIVMLSNYYIDVYEVTNADYTLCEVGGRCTSPYEVSSATRDLYYGNSHYDDYPVVHIDWNQAQTYCEWRGARLPTEAEWEKEARSMEQIPYPWGTQKPEEHLLNFNRKVGDTEPIGSYPQGMSPYGIYDMAGNVSEWIADTYGGYPSDSQTDPTGPDFGTRKVFRGGGWQSSGEHIRTTNREWAETVVGNEDYFYDVGFRCALTP